jgi:hypothetical protein
MRFIDDRRMTRYPKITTSVWHVGYFGRIGRLSRGTLCPRSRRKVYDY